MFEPRPETRQWLLEARSGSSAALGELLESCRGYLLLVARRELGNDLQAKIGASDLVQETLMEAVRDFAGFTGSTEEDLIAWLRRLLINNLTDTVRRYRESDKRQVDREVSLTGTPGVDGPMDSLTTTAPSPSDAALHNEDSEAVNRLLQQLPVDHRQVLLWRYQESLSYEEIGRRLDLTPNAARKLLLRAVRQVQDLHGEPG